MMPRDASLSGNYTSDRGCFPNGAQQRRTCLFQCWEKVGVLWAFFAAFLERWLVHTQRILFEILFIQTEISLDLLFSD